MATTRHDHRFYFSISLRSTNDWSQTGVIRSAETYKTDFLSHGDRSAGFGALTDNFFDIAVDNRVRAHNGINRIDLKAAKPLPDFIDIKKM